MFSSEYHAQRICIWMDFPPPSSISWPDDGLHLVDYWRWHAIDDFDRLFVSLPLLLEPVYLGELKDLRPPSSESRFTAISVPFTGRRLIVAGAYDDEEAAARTYDLAALKYWGPDTVLNFPVSPLLLPPPPFPPSFPSTRRRFCEMQMNTYAKEFEEMQAVSKEEYLASLRRSSSGFSRGVSKYRGVAR